ncbi:hypothetical protein KM043_018009 [Ampulex compressa]|nr:hypothetical protein KM043_018009 [Ampulex compressa]
MGSGPGNKPSHGGHGYKAGAVTVLSALLSGGTEDRAYARAEQEQSEFKKQKDRDGGRPVYESKKRVAARPYERERSGARRKTTAGSGERSQSVWRAEEKSRNTGSHPTGI